jgi:hypothetical protein
MAYFVFLLAFSAARNLPSDMDTMDDVWDKYDTESEPSLRPQDIVLGGQALAVVGELILNRTGPYFAVLKIIPRMI